MENHPWHVELLEFPKNLFRGKQFSTTLLLLLLLHYYYYYCYSATTSTIITTTAATLLASSFSLFSPLSKVNNRYVLKKIGLILNPLSNKSWDRKRADENTEVSMNAEVPISIDKYRDNY